MRILILSIVIIGGWAAPTFSQNTKSGSHRPLSQPSPLIGEKAKSSVGVDFYSLTLDRAGGVWLCGTAWQLRGLILNDRLRNMKPILIPKIHAVQQCVFPTQSVGWVLSGHSLFWTGDEGGSWSAVQLPGNPKIERFDFIDRNNGWAAGSDGSLFQTIDAGRSWRRVEAGFDYDFRETVFTDHLHGWLIGSKLSGNLKWNLILLKTDDGGNSWEVLSNEDSVSPRSVDSLQFVDPLRGWGFDGANNIVHTTDGGRTWATQYPHQAQWNSLYFLNEAEGWAAGNGILHTSDGGRTWNYQWKPKTTGVFVRQVVFDGKNGWALTTTTLLRTVDGGVTWTEVADSWKSQLPAYETLLNESRRKNN
jgi:photosystem II stability/assembly factor-like uncharacterized protein